MIQGSKISLPNPRRLQASKTPKVIIQTYFLPLWVSSRQVIDPTGTSLQYAKRWKWEISTYPGKFRIMQNFKIEMIAISHWQCQRVQQFEKFNVFVMDFAEGQLMPDLLLLHNQLFQQSLIMSGKENPKINSRKRQKKGEVQGDFKCKVKGCQKLYLSYPALYTHIKNKHGNSVKPFEFHYPVPSRVRPPETGWYKRKTQAKGTIQIHDQINNLKPAKISLQISIESMQCLDDMLLEFSERSLTNLILIGENAINSKSIFREDICKSFSDTCQFMEDQMGNGYKDENYQDLKKLFEEVMSRKKNEEDEEDEQLIKNDLIFASVDEAICLFLKALSVNMKVSFLVNIELMMLILRKWINDEYKVDNQILYTKEQSPREIAKFLNKFIIEVVPKELTEERLREFYKELKDNQKQERGDGLLVRILLNEEKGNWIIQTVLLYFGNWLFFQRFSATQLQFDE